MNVPHEFGESMEEQRKLKFAKALQKAETLNRRMKQFLDFATEGTFLTASQHNQIREKLFKGLIDKV